MSVERLNFDSFVEWPLTEAVHPERLADAGFVYTGVGDLVKCFQCGVQHHNWPHPGDNPLDMHHPCCPFLQPDDVAVVPSGLQFFSSQFAIGDSLQQCEYRDDQAVHVVPQVPQATLNSSRSNPRKEGKADCSPFEGIKAIIRMPRLISYLYKTIDK